MGKKGSWISALKRAFTSSKSPEKKNANEKKGWGLGKSKHGEPNSFIPLYREPSSIEKILGDAEREQYHKLFRGTERDKQYDKVLGEEIEREQKHKNIRGSLREHQHQHQHPHQKNSGVDERERHRKATGDGPREQSHRLQHTSSKKVQRFKAPASRSTVTLNHVQISAIKIQAAYRGYRARKSFRALKGLVRLQGVMRGNSVKRQTMNTMRCMQMLVRVQSQVRARRLQVIESQNVQQRKSDKEAESSKWSLTHQTETEEDAHEEWEDSMLTKEEMDARMQRKVEAVIKRERALAYAYSHQLLNVTSKSAHAVLSDIRSGGFPWWWNWLDRHQTHPATPKPAFHAAGPLRPGSSRSRPGRAAHDLDAATPRSSAKPLPSPRASISSNRWRPPPQTRHAMRDDESLTSCPAYTVPRYMAPTASATAKVRGSVDEEDVPGKRRFSFGLGSSIGSLRWAKAGSMFSVVKDPPPTRTLTARHRSTHSIGGLSVDSTVSLPVGVGRKPFR